MLEQVADANGGLTEGDAKRQRTDLAFDALSPPSSPSHPPPSPAYPPSSPAHHVVSEDVHDSAPAPVQLKPTQATTADSALTSRQLAAANAAHWEGIVNLLRRPGCRGATAVYQQLLLIRGQPADVSRYASKALQYAKAFRHAPQSQVRIAIEKFADSVKK